MTRLDQHFLIDDAAADSIVYAAGDLSGKDVVEIGPGKGVLTGRMLRSGARVTAVELDAGLADSLERRFAGEALAVVRGDFLKHELSRLPAPTVVVSNLPYSVATPILQRLLDWPGWELAVLMFQREVAQRIVAEPGSRQYGLLTLAVRIKSDATAVCEVPSACFDPRPKVDSAVLQFRRLPAPRLPDDVAEKDFFRVVRAAFSQRRKMAVNSISGALRLERGEVAEVFGNCGIETRARAETIGLEEFVGLARALAQGGKL